VFAYFYNIFAGAPYDSHLRAFEPLFF